MKRPFRRIALVLAVTITGELDAQETVSTADSVTVRGVVTDSATARVLELARVRVSGLQDSVVSTTSGRFSFRMPSPMSITLTVTVLGYQPTTVRFDVSSDSLLTIRLVRQATTLPTVRAVAGLYSVGNDRTAALTALQVATTPGAANDIARAIQTLPGVQTVDEGSGLFVRGGDPSETRVLLNGVAILNPFRFETPIGSTSPSVNPFLLRSIAFSSGGFGARFGNALSGIVDLVTLGRPSVKSIALNAGVTFASAGISLPTGANAGIRLNASRYSTAFSNDLNGTVRDYETAPNGSDASAQVTWAYRKGAEVNLFGIRQTNQFSVETEDAMFKGLYSNAQQSRSVVLSWREAFGSMFPSISIGRSSVDRSEESGALGIATSQSIATLAADIRWQLGLLDVIRSGLELETDHAALSGTVPFFFYRRNSADPVRLVDADARITRLSAFLEGSWQLGQHWRLGPSVRADDTRSLHPRITFDPRMSVAFRANDQVTYTAAVGQYSQRPDAMSLARVHPITVSVPRATHFIVGAQRETSSLLMRVEVFDKRYDHLLQFDRQRQPVSTGSGASRGADAFARWTGPAGFTVRSTLSLLMARRTDPDARTIARAPNDISHSSASVVEKSWPAGWRLALAYRDASGRPFTPVVDADQLSIGDASDQRVWLPVFGESFSAELPALRRYDAGLSFRRPFAKGQAVCSLSVTNLFDRHNVSGVRYSADYSGRTMIRSPVKRMVYIGFSLTYLP